MRNKSFKPEVLRGISLAALLAAGLLSGCATIESVLGPIGTSMTPPPAGEGEGAQKAEIDCPAVTIRTGASAWQISAGPGPTNVRYQGSLGQLARECAVLGETMTMRVGVEGRILVGPKGGPGSVNVPMRIALVQEGPQPRAIWSKFYSVPVAVPPGASQALFSHVEDDLTFAMPANKVLDNYIVYVGFDPQGAVAAGKADAKGKSKAAPTPKAAPAAKAEKKKKAPPPKSSQPKEQQPAFEPPPSGGAGSSGVFEPPPGQR